jgi:hypothetical protein
MQFIILPTEPTEKFADRTDPERSGAYWASWSAFVESINASGIVVSAAALEPPTTATTVRRRDGELVLHDGPFADSKEQLGGFFVIDVPDLDAALEWAARCPSSDYGSVEVRPVLSM